jgi:hypothetical protein
MSLLAFNLTSLFDFSRWYLEKMQSELDRNCTDTEQLLNLCPFARLLNSAQKKEKTRPIIIRDS